jgi:hypothetical protein
MNKSKKKNKNILQKIMNKSKSFNKKLNKTIKNKTTLKKCEDFCKNDYMVEMKKVFKKSSKKYNIPYKSPTKQEDEFAYNTCKKTFCNEKCEGYDFFGDKQKQIDFKKKIKNGFQDTYSRNKVEMLKKRGALSGCVDIIDYDVFHK